MVREYLQGTRQLLRASETLLTFEAKTEISLEGVGKGVFCAAGFEPKNSNSTLQRGASAHGLRCSWRTAGLVEE